MLTITTQDSPVIGKIVQGALTLPKVCHALPLPLPLTLTLEAAMLPKVCHAAPRAALRPLLARPAVPERCPRPAMGAPLPRRTRHARCVDFAGCGRARHRCHRCHPIAPPHPRRRC